MLGRMSFWARGRRYDLLTMVQRRIDAAPADDRDWLVGLEVARGAQDMESTLRAAGLADGVEPLAIHQPDDVHG